MKLISERDVRFVIGVCIFGAAGTLVYWAMQINTDLVLPAGIASLVLLLLAANISRVPSSKD